MRLLCFNNPVNVLFTLSTVVLSLTSLSRACHASTPSESMVVLRVQFQNGDVAWGTGTFVDHDGLILTADHVIHTTKPDPLSTMTNTPPAGRAPIRITAYSYRLRSSLEVNMADPKNVLGGTVNNFWLDAAFVRVTLTDMQRVQIEPLDIASTAPNQNEVLSGWGPACLNMSNINCYAVNVVSTTLSSLPAAARDYSVKGQMSEGYSGGALINASGNIVGIASYGDHPDGSFTGTQLVNATYLPATLLNHYFVDSRGITHVSPSPWLSVPGACTNTSQLLQLTALDIQEMFPTSAPAATDCPCCCTSLSRAPNAMGTSAAYSNCTQQPSCLQQQVLALARSVQLDAVTGNIDAQTAANYGRLRGLVAAVDFPRLSKPNQTQIYEHFGDASLALATSGANTEFHSLSTAGDDALVAYKARAVLGDSAAIYADLSKVYELKKDAGLAATAQIISAYTGAPKDTQKTMKLNVNDLKKNLLQGVPPDLARQAAIQGGGGVF